METATASNMGGGQGSRLEETPHQNAPTKGERILHLENECHRLTYVVDTLEGKVENLEAENIDLNRRLNESRDAWISMRVINRGPAGRTENVGAGGGLKKRIPEPQLYSGVRNAKEVDNFLFDMEQYFLAADIEDEAERIATATMYLTGDAKQWWHGKYQDIRDRCERLDTWDLLQAAIQKQFFLENVGYNARKALRELKQTGTVNEYTKAFASILLDLPNMDEESKKKPPAPNGGQQKGNGGRSFRPGYNKGGGERSSHTQESSQRSSDRGRPQGGNKATKSSRFEGCFLCNGPHMLKDCPKRQLINALCGDMEWDKQMSKKKEKEPVPVPEEREEDSESEGENLGAFSHRCNALSRTAAQKGKALPKSVKTAPVMEGGAAGEPSIKSTKEKGLMFVDVKINGKPIRAMVDTGATHNYLASTEVERLGLVLEKRVGRVKAINSAAQPIAEVAKSVLIKVGPYEGWTNLSVVTMDDFKLILRLDFLRDAKMAVMPHAGALMMMGNKPCVAQTVSHKTSLKPLSAMKFVKGCQKNEPSFLCTLRIEDIEEKSGKIPEVVKKILREFEDTMPDELPKKLPLKRATDNTAVSYFLTKPKLTAKQARWQELLAEFNFSLEYRAGSSNHVADALSRRADLEDQQVVAALASSKVTTNLKTRIRELTKEDPTAQGLINLVEQKKTRNFWLEEGLLKTKGNQLYVPKGGDLRRSIIMRDEIEMFVRTYIVCQQDKADQHKKARLLEPLPIPSRPWKSVSMDFITGLPKVGDLDAIVVVVDRFSKYATFVPAPKTITTEETTQLFFKHIVKFWGLPRDIVSDWDSRFTGNFRTELFRLLGSKLNMSSSFHPQSEGQTERFNSMLEEYLQHFVSANQKDWVKLLDTAQLCFNAQKCSTTNGTPFEICTRVSPAQSFSLEWKQNLDLARSYLVKAQKRMKKYADQKRRFVEYRVGDRIMVKVPDQRLSKVSRGRDARLMPKYIGPLTILQRIGKVAYRVELPPWWRIHNVIHVSQLKPFQADKVDATRNMLDHPQLRLANNTGKRIAEAILYHRNAAK
ncbi:hypothetical protein C2S52_007130 [Perilla frutescens var. hirtella]|nr:hypothetical protein C2S52_007130 [Perilla frutescens var. hirtella]